MTNIKPQPYDKLLRKALELLTEASTIRPEKTGDMRDLEKIWDLESQATMLMDSYDMMRKQLKLQMAIVVKPEPWCCICERYVLETDKQVHSNGLVVHRTCYSRVEKFFRSSKARPCEIALGADLVDGPVFCGKPAVHLVDCGAGCMHWTCDEHVQAQK